MTDHSTLEGKIEALSKKVDSQARFTRGVMLLCTTAILAVVFYTMIELLTTMPTCLIAVVEKLHGLSHVVCPTAAPAAKSPSSTAPSK